MKKKTKKKTKALKTKVFEAYGVVESGYILEVCASNKDEAKSIIQSMTGNQWLITGQLDSRSVDFLWCREKKKEKKCRKQKQ